MIWSWSGLEQKDTYLSELLFFIFLRDIKKQSLNIPLEIAGVENNHKIETNFHFSSKLEQSIAFNSSYQVQLLQLEK